MSISLFVCFLSIIVCCRNSYIDLTEILREDFFESDKDEKILIDLFQKFGIGNVQNTISSNALITSIGSKLQF